MEHNLSELVAAKNELVLNGKMIEATQKFFALNAKSVDFDGSRTRNQAEMITKMEQTGLDFRQKRVQTLF